jgi:hypothetical protein
VPVFVEIGPVKNLRRIESPASHRRWIVVAGKALVEALAASARRRAIASLSEHQLAKLGVDRRSLGYFARHGRLPAVG